MSTAEEFKLIHRSIAAASPSPSSGAAQNVASAGQVQVSLNTTGPQNGDYRILNNNRAAETAPNVVKRKKRILPPIRDSKQITEPVEEAKQERLNWYNSLSIFAKDAIGCFVMCLVISGVTVLIVWRAYWKSQNLLNLYYFSNAPLPLNASDPNSFNGQLTNIAFTYLPYIGAQNYTSFQGSYSFFGPIQFSQVSQYTSSLTQGTQTQRLYQCSSASNVSAVLKGINSPFKASIRSGGQSINSASLYGQYVITLEQFPHTVVQTQQNIIQVSPSTRTGELLYFLHSNVSAIFNCIVPRYPMIGVSGFVLGGGHGLMSSWYGIAAHYLQSASVIFANGIEDTVNDNNYPDLMMALRGAGQNLVVVTQLNFDFSTIPQHYWNLVLFSLEPAYPKDIESALTAWFQVTGRQDGQWAASLEINTNANKQVAMLLWTLAPAGIHQVQDLIDLTQTVYFSKVQFIQNYTIESSDWYTLSNTNIPYIGSISNVWQNQDIPGSSTSQNSNQWVSDVVWQSQFVYNLSGIQSNVFSNQQGFMPQHMQLDNHQFLSTGPYESKSYYLSNSIRAANNISTLLTMYDVNQQNLAGLLPAFNIVYGWGNPNYAPNSGVNYMVWNFFSYQQSQQLEQLRQKYDPQNIMTNPLQLN